MVRKNRYNDQKKKLKRGAFFFWCNFRRDDLKARLINTRKEVTY